MTKDELLELAAVGMKEKLWRMERQLAQIHRDFPQLFIGEAPPQFVRPELKNGSGHEWPITVGPSETQKKISASWTPARRKRQAELLSARRHLMTRHPKKRGALIGKIRNYLEQRGGTANLTAITKGVKATGSSSIISAMQSSLKNGTLIKSGPGQYSLGPQSREAE